ncbi:glycosyltransferase family 2 protein [Leucobacter insecticola]|uniref:Glycosyltransferase family 2 protein n=1 Tax=Leucobacter insecticola TaxID=2714934 RepID=A0A6G8FK28_9MICO|nr:glycosyltransferase family 2 protein [Leucobacter insecticola]QIM16796.1 glycosyltransferase family 2 protein [Leucobacter insecticola]
MILSPLPERPAVSYVMPVLNEEGFLEAAVRTILAQEYQGEKEIVLALGPSRDRSSEIAKKIAAEDHRVRLVENPARDIPAGLNLAIAASKHPVVIRVDAHSELTPDYTSLGVSALRETGAANVGGIMRAAGRSPVQRAIARGYNSPYGLGGGAYHGDGTPGAAESAYLGIFRREALDAVGGYDPAILRGEDWELNLRIRRAGGIVWFAPALQVTYWPRASLSDLRKQFFATGTWRAVLVRKYGRANPWRFFAPGALVVFLALSLVALVLLSVGALPWASWWSLLLLPLAGYVAGIVFATIRIREQRGVADRILTAVTLITMHVSWGTGFLRGITLGGGRVVDRSRA